MPRIYSRTQKIHKKFITCTQPFFDDPKNKEVYDGVKSGKNTYLRVDRTESSDLDITWVKRIEDCIPQLGTIVSNPRKVIQTLSEVVITEKAKKVTRESVQHLASHTQFVKTIDEMGNVTPSKVLNIYNDDNIKIYENKFIATLIRHLILFVEKRYDYIVHNATMRDVSLLYYKGQSQIDDNEIEVETRVRYSKPSEGEGADKLRTYLHRINEIRKYLRYFNYTEFMKIMHSERDVRNPILQTNIIRKNPTYRKCYHLWLFIEKYTGAGIDVRVAETVYDISPAELENINKAMFVDYITLRAKDNDSKGTPKYREYQPKILKTLDDEVYTFGSLYDGPVDYIRIDSKFREFMERPRNVPAHPTKAEQAYFKKDYEHNKQVRETAAAVDALIKRREAEAKQYLKETKALYERQKREAEAALKQAELEKSRAQEQRVADARSLLIAAALKDNGFGPEEEEEEIIEEEVEVEEPVVEPTPEPEYQEPIVDDEQVDEDYVLPAFEEVYGEHPEMEFPEDSVKPLFSDDEYGFEEKQEEEETPSIEDEELPSLDDAEEETPALEPTSDTESIEIGTAEEENQE